MNKPCIGFSEVRTAATGQWERIHQSAGITLQTISHRKHTPCPGCGGHDRFRVMPEYMQTGRWFCSGGGAPESGDGFALLGHVFGWSQAEQLAAVKRVLGLDDRMTPTQRQTLQQQADAYQKTMAAQVAAKEERFRCDWNIIGSIIELEDSIKYRQHCQRIVNRALNPSEEEQGIAYQLNQCLLESYRAGGAK